MKIRWLAAPLFMAAFGCARKAAPPPVAPAPPPIVATEDSPDVEEFLDRKERWAVKTGADPGASQVPLDLDNATPTTVAALVQLSRPKGMPLRGGKADSRVPPVETTLYSLNVDIIRYKLENDDGDFHVVVRDHGGSSRTMIVEVPHPEFVSSKSPFRPYIEQVRETFDERLHPTRSWKKKPAHAKIVGVGFFDFKHGQSGVAKNGIELHPLLRVEFLDNP